MAARCAVRPKTTSRHARYPLAGIDKIDSMLTPSCRLLPYESACGARNMAADEALLESAAAGRAALRFYGWSPPTLSLGYFQPAGVRVSDERLAGLPYVRRPSGGLTLVHHREVTYALAVPPGAPWQGGEPWPWRMHRVITVALGELGVTVRPHRPAPGEHFEGPLCFRHHTEGDLLIGTDKVVGSAQRKMRGALLQHGGILLERSPFTPTLPGIRELTGRRPGPADVVGAIATALARETGWSLLPGEWSAEERRRVEELAETKYGRASWNDKR